jgi:hypothetical protein
LYVLPSLLPEKTIKIEEIKDSYLFAYMKCIFAFYFISYSAMKYCSHCSEVFLRVIAISHEGIKLFKGTT